MHPSLFLGILLPLVAPAVPPPHISDGSPDTQGHAARQDVAHCGWAYSYAYQGTTPTQSPECEKLFAFGKCKPLKPAYSPVQSIAEKTSYEITNDMCRCKFYR